MWMQKPWSVALLTMLWKNSPSGLTVLLASMLILAGALAATKQAGWQVLGFLTGVAFLYLGGAALLLPDYAGSWGTMGGVLALFAGLGYLTATLLEARKAGQLTGSKAADTGSVSS